ncbi:MAG: carbon storage regulator [Phycisphaerales bacterium]
MLVLSRRRNESIVITPPGFAPTDRITITVVDVIGDKVRLGVEAPITTSIHRAEVQARVDQGEPPPPPCHRDLDAWRKRP